MESDCDDKLCSSVVIMDKVEFVLAMSMVASEVREYQQVQGAHIHPTVDVDSDDFKEPPVSHGIPACPGVGACGASGRVAPTAADATHLLQLSRSSGKAMPHHGEVAVSHVDANDLISIHPFLFCFLMSLYQSPGELQRVLTQSWVSAWDGWTEASAMIEHALTSHDVSLIA